MNENQSAKDPKYNLVDTVNDLKEQLEALKTQRQNVGALNVQLRADTEFTITTTINAGTIKILSVDFTPQDTILTPTPIFLGVSVFIDTDNDQNFLLRRGTSLSSGQLKSLVSVWEDWKAENTPMDPLTQKHFNIQIYNFDASNHVYYIHCSPFALSGALPLTVNIV